VTEKDIVYYVVEIKEDESQKLHNFPCFSDVESAEQFAKINEFHKFQVVLFEV
jgi:hypothetical protein